MSTKTLRKDCEQELKLTADALKLPQRKELFKSIINEYNARTEPTLISSSRSSSTSSSSRRSNRSFTNMISNDDGNDRGKCLTISKRFSNAESLLIMNTTKEYVRRNGLLISDVCRGLRDIDDKVRRRYPLWEELGNLLKKDKNAIWHHANMKLMAEYGGNELRVWSDEDKARLKTLVDCHGNDWATIGRIMGRLDKTCNHTYQRITFVKKITGRFSMEEDMALIKAVREDRGIDENVPVQEMNVTGTKWSLERSK
jgi:hypothetical protein